MVADVADLDFNSDTFDGESANADDIVAASNTLPFGSERRLVVVRKVDKLAKDGQERLAAYAADPSPTTVLVLVATKLAKNTKLFKAVDKAGGAAEYAAPKKADYPTEVRRLFEARGKSIDPAAAQLMVSAVGYDLRRLSAEVDKAVAYVGSSDRVTLEDVRQAVSTTAVSSVFELAEAVGERDLHASLRLSAELFDAGESVYALHALVLRRVRDLMAARALADRGQGGSAKLAQAMGRPEWQMRSLAKQARNYRPEELVAALRAAAQTEAKMKTSRDDEARLAFERWIVKICG